MSVIFSKATNFSSFSGMPNYEANVEYFVGKVITTCTTYEWDYFYEDAVAFDPETETVTKIPCGGDHCVSAKVTIDATPEVRAAYERYLDKKRRHERAVYLWDEHNYMIKKAHTMNLTVKEMKKLQAVYSTVHFDWIFNLLKTKKFRNTFRQAMNDQIRAWVKEDEHKYRRPLSDKQLSYLQPYRPW